MFTKYASALARDKSELCDVKIDLMSIYVFGNGLMMRNIGGAAYKSGNWGDSGDSPGTDNAGTEIPGHRFRGESCPRPLPTSDWKGLG